MKPAMVFLHRAFRSTSYVFSVLLWLWLTLLLMPVLIDSGIMEVLIPDSQQPPVVQNSPELPKEMLVAIGVAVTVIMLVLTVVAIVRMPRDVARSGSKVTHVTTEKIVPVLLHKQKLSQKKKREYSARVLAYVRLGFIVVPMVAILFAPPMKDVDPAIGVIMGSILALVALICMAAEYCILHTLRPKER